MWGLSQNTYPVRFCHSRCRLYLLLFFIGAPGSLSVSAQDTAAQNLSQQIQELKDAMASTQAQLEQSQRQLNAMQKQLSALEQQVTQSVPAPGSPPDSSTSASAPQSEPADTAAAIDDLREQQEMQASQIATHDQTKVESESKFPVKVTGLLLFNAFVNTAAVDAPSTPTLAIPGSGSTGATVRQTVLGIDAQGPHVLGAESYADLRVDFDGMPQSASPVGSYTGAYSANATFLRLRTAHAGLHWNHTDVHFALDRPIFNPDSATSLTAVAVPALAWSGNLWTWNPQAGVRQMIPISRTRDIQLEAALVDVGEAPLTPTISYGFPSGTPPSSAEQSRWPGLDAHIALLGSKSRETGSQIGFGGHFAPLRDPNGRLFDSWAGTVDTRLGLPAGLTLTANAYRGLALGGLGGGAYKDFTYHLDPDSGAYYFHPLNDVGGWAQLKEAINERLELNAALGIDNAFANELMRDAIPGGPIYLNLARNQTITGNVIYKPSAYLLFSLEYRHLESSPLLSPPSANNVIGLGAGFKF